MSLKSKMLFSIALICMTAVLLIVGVWALKSASFSIGGTINFTAKGIQATISKGTLNYDEAWVTASDANTKMPQIKITNSSTEETLKSSYDQWKGLELVFNEDGDDVVLTFTITNDSDNAKEYINASVTANAGITPDNATITPSPTSATIAPGEANKQTFTITFHITDTDYNASLTGFSIGVNLSYVEMQSLRVESNNTTYGTASANVSTYKPGDSITLTATPKSGYTFVAWAEDSVDGNFVSTNATYTFTATENTASTYYAVFNSTTSTYTSNNLTYTLYNQIKTATLTDGKSYTNASLTVPGTVTSGGVTYKVKIVGANAFFTDPSEMEGNLNITSVTISEGVNILSQSCFAYCKQIANVSLPNTLKNINSAFATNMNLTSIVIPDSVISMEGAFFNCSQLNSVTIGKGVTNIGVQTFKYNSSLKNITIPGNVLSIGEQAFAECSGLESVIIEDGVKNIDKRAFYYCSNLSSLSVPESIESIGEDALRGCNNLTFETFSNANYLGNEDNLYAVLYKATSTDITSCTVNEKCRFINDDAFSGCSSLESITIGKGVTTIGEDAFYNCGKSLETIEIDDNNKVYNDGNGRNCIIESSSNTLILGCKNTEIPNTVTAIGDSAFYSCSGLTSVSIPDSVISIGSGAFYDCGALTEVNYLGDINSWVQIEFITDKSNPIYYSKSLKINGVEVTNAVIDTATTINAYAFYYCTKLTSVTIGNQVTSIGDDAFHGCTGLTGKLTISDGVETIGDDAFSGCTGITSLTIGNSVATIGDSAYFNCYNIKTIIIPISVTVIGQNAFGECSITNQYYRGNETQWNSITRESGNESIWPSKFNYTGE